MFGMSSNEQRGTVFLILVQVANVFLVFLQKNTYFISNQLTQQMLIKKRGWR